MTGLRIAAVSEYPVPVLFTGGVHSCEWAPPDALLSFCQRLLTAYTNKSDIVYPLFTDATGVV